MDLAIQVGMIIFITLAIFLALGVPISISIDFLLQWQCY